MRAGTTSVSAWSSQTKIEGIVLADDNAVHSELGDDKYTFANDAAAWILARSNVDGTESKAQ